MSALQINTIAHVIYIGDYDPAGVLIDVSLERELRKHLATSIDLDEVDEAAQP